MSRDWSNPVWNAAFCSGQGGFVGEEVKEANVKPEYVWFDGTSYVYNVGETIQPDRQTIFYIWPKPTARLLTASRRLCRSNDIFPTCLCMQSGKIIPPAIMWMFMTGDFDIAVQKGMRQAEKGRERYTGNYAMFRLMPRCSSPMVLIRKKKHLPV